MSIKDFTKVAIISLLFIVIVQVQITWAAVQETFTIYYPSKVSDIQRVSCAEGAQYVFQVSGAPGNAIYEWHFSGGNWSGGGSSVTFTPTTKGSYTVTVKVSIPGPGPGEPWIFTGTRAIDYPTIVFSLYDGRDKGYVCKDDPSPIPFKLKATVTHDEVSKALKGVEVTFTVDPAKGSFTKNPDTTNSSGIADQCSYTPDVTAVGNYILYAESKSPKQKGPTIYVFEVTKIDIWDSDGRYAKNKLLEIVAPLLGENVNGKAFLNPPKIEPEDLPRWLLDGIQQKTGVNVAYKLIPPALSPGIDLVITIGCNTYVISCEKAEPVTVKAFPSVELKLEYDFKEAAENLQLKLQSYPVFGSEITQCIKLPNGVVSYSNWWEEKEDNRIIFCFIGDCALDPVIGWEGKVQLLGPPDYITKYVSVEAGIYLIFGGAIKLAGVVGRDAERPQGYGGGELEGSLGGGFSAEANLANCLEAEISSTTDVTLSGSIYVKPDSLNYKPKGEFGGVEIKVAFKVSLLKKWEFTKKWQPVKKFPFYDPGEKIILNWGG